MGEIVKIKIGKMYLSVFRLFEGEYEHNCQFDFDLDYTNAVELRDINVQETIDILSIYMAVPREYFQIEKTGKVKPIGE